MDWTRRFLGHCGIGIAVPAIIVLAVTLALLLALGYHLYLLCQLLGTTIRGIAGHLVRWWHGSLQESLTPGAIILAFPIRRYSPTQKVP